MNSEVPIYNSKFWKMWWFLYVAFAVLLSSREKKPTEIRQCDELSASVRILSECVPENQNKSVFVCMNNKIGEKKRNNQR